MSVSSFLMTVHISIIIMYFIIIDVYGHDTTVPILSVVFQNGS